MHNNRDVLRYISPNTAHVANSANVAAKTFKNAIKREIDENNISDNVRDRVKEKSSKLQTNE